MSPDRPENSPDLTASLGDPNATTGGAPTSAVPATAKPSDRYQIGAEIARGGMGVVYRAVDTVLNREVAIKVLGAQFDAASGAASRFATEARITGQLQHPNIPAVHDLGTLPDGRPFLAMKLIKGDTLSELLKARPTPSTDRGRWIAVFEAICHGVAYAHAHGVIHRDLKPSNVMVGNHGDVQVMDWGLAKLTTGNAGEQTGTEADPQATAPLTKIGSTRDGDEFTQAGSVLGTPAFMPPEQAIGAVDQIDMRSDVFSLGGILATILTNDPPFVGPTAESTRQMAAKGKIAECFARLDRCGADPELVALCRQCLAPEKDDRPANAGMVARAVAELRAAADERAKAADVERARAEVQAAEQRKRRRTVVVAGGALVLVLIAGVVVSMIGFFGAEAQRKTAEQQRDVIADREQQVIAQKKLADDRLKVYAAAVNRFVNDAPLIIDGHPLGAAPARELSDLAADILREVQATNVDDRGLAARGEMSALIRQGQMAQQQLRVDEAERHFEAAYRIAEEQLRAGGEKGRGRNVGNLALLLAMRAGVRQSRAEILLSWSDPESARPLFAEAAKIHEEGVAMCRKVADDPAANDIHTGEAKLQLASALLSLAELHRAAVRAEESNDGRRAAHEAGRAAAAEAEREFAAGFATGWAEWNLTRMRLRQAMVSHERATAANALDRLDEADEAFQRAFTLYDKLVTDTPTNLHHRIWLARLASAQGHFLMTRRADGKRAEVAYRVAADQYARVAQPYELYAYADDVGGMLYSAGIALQVAGEKEKAIELFRKSAAAHQGRIWEAVRAQGEKSTSAVWPRIRLMWAQARLGDHEAAAAYAAVLRRDHSHYAPWAYSAAQGFALSAAATTGPKAAEYLDKAFEAMERAIEVGYTNVRHLTTDYDFDPMRADPRFAPLVEKVKEKARLAATKPKPKLAVEVPLPARSPDNPLAGRWERNTISGPFASRLDFTADGQFVKTGGYGKYSMQVEGTYQRDGDKIHVVVVVAGMKYPHTFIVKTLTDTELVLEYAGGGREDFTRVTSTPK